ncbi:MAG: class I SAM-dependent methyltransferase [Burkholderiaceae bacterium]|jgi:predicted O-methyltransferase YrrM|nr:class I SAM-dependent methyltransferase [Burkholderiaceae bacterium]
MFKSLLKKLPAIDSLIRERDALIAERDSFKKISGFVPPGHFYSPIISIDEAKRDENRIFLTNIPRRLPGIDMNEEGQLANLDKFEEIYPSIDFPTNKENTHRYYYENPAYSYSDAIMLHCMLRTIQPRRIIEVGSGYSSCMMLDTNEKYLEKSTEFTFIEPYPELLKSLIRNDDLESINIVETRLQDVPLTAFSKLERDDVLFIDSTHVSKTGSDVNFLLLEILPSLKSGVYVHLHDIFYPFEYPKEWVFMGISWNEVYVLRAFLQFNNEFSIEMMNTFLEYFHEQRFAERMPLCLKNRGGSIWLRKR